MAMVVKLTRVMLLAPVALLLAFLFTLKAEKQVGKTKHHSFSWKKIPVPWFVFGFLAVGAINSSGWLSKSIGSMVLQVSIFLMVMAMAAMGLMVDLTVIRKTGLKALAVALLIFSVFIVVSSALIYILGLA